MVEKITVGDELLAVVVRNDYSTEGLSFFTPNEFPFQFGMHVRAKGDDVKAHKHVPFEVLRNLAAQEFFYVKKGKISVGIYHNDKEYKRVVLGAGDMIVVNCAHDVKFLEDTQMIELKQGPYRGKEEEKRYF